MTRGQRIAWSVTGAVWLMALVYGAYVHAQTLSSPGGMMGPTSTNGANGLGALRDNNVQYSPAIVEANTAQNRASISFRVVTASTTQTVYYTYQYTIQ